jgi:hypothetical protein
MPSKNVSIVFTAGTVLIAGAALATHRGLIGVSPFPRLIALAICWLFAELAIHAAWRKSAQLRPWWQGVSAATGPSSAN